MKDNLCAGVLDTTFDYYKNAVGLSNNDNYINTGFLLIDLKKWRVNKVEDRFIDFLKFHDGKVIHDDQGIINGTLNKEILIIEPKYNMLSTFYEMSYDQVINWYGLEEYYDKDILCNSIRNPIFIHLVNFLNGRPWFIKNKNHPFFSIYNEYAISTPFIDDIYIEDNRPFKLRSLSLLSKILPYTILNRIYYLYRKYLIKILH